MILFLLLASILASASDSVYFGADTPGIGTSYEATATGDTTTTSGTDVLIGSMTLTPVAGKYLVIFSTSMINSSNGGVTHGSIYVGGSQVAESDRQVTSLITGIVVGNQPNQVMLYSDAIVTVNGSQAIEARWRVSGGTSTAHQRAIKAIKIGG